MHPLLLFTLFFIPGIKTSYVRYKDLNSLRTNDLAHTVDKDSKTTDLDLPKFLDRKITEGFKGHVKSHYDKHHGAEVEKHQIIGQELQQERHYLPTSNGVRKDIHHFTNYESTPSPDYHQFRFNDKYYDKKHYKKKGKKEERKVFADRKWGSKSEKQKFIESNDEYNKPTNVKPEKVAYPTSEHWSDRDRKNYIRATQELLKRHRFYVNGGKELKSVRIKREEDSSESNDGLHKAESAETLEKNEQSQKDLEDIEKIIIAQLYESEHIDDSHKDTADIDIKKKDHAHEKVPIVEKLHTKSKAYMSCKDGNTMGCGMRNHHKEDNQVLKSSIQSNNHHVEDPSSDDDDDDAQDIADWLKDLEDQILV